ncbi:MAG: hypothetical protein IPK10_05410 [Bacteroidetes bacterium]|nr:hypothetical protein [Bacteroidota bacterium]
MSGNEDGMNGKLTLNGIYFTYGKNSRGALNQYKFTYSSSNPDYNPMAIDRWGNYKRNNSPHNNGLSNHFFPYVAINKAEADIDATAWSLTKIELPTGGIIAVEYESDDYAFVQDKRACEMTHVIAIGRSSNYSSVNNVLYDNSKTLQIFGSLSREPVTSKADIKAKYIADLTHLYFKSLLL